MPRAYPTCPALDPRQVADLLHRYRPRRWRVYQSRYRRDHGGTGLADWQGKILSVPTLIDAGDIHTFLHECGHVHLGHGERDIPDHLAEYEAEMYGLHVMWAERLTLPPMLVSESRRIIGEAIAADMLKGVSIDPHALAWADGKRLKLEGL